MNDLSREFDLDRRRERLRRVYDPQLLPAVAGVLGERLADYMRTALASSPTMYWRRPDEQVERAAAYLDSAPGVERMLGVNEVADRFGRLTDAVLAGGHRLHSPNYMGHQVPASVPLAGLFEAIASATNQCMAIYEMGPFVTGIEKAIIGKLGGYLGWRPGEYAAVGTHGGSLANLTALLTARNVRYPHCWQRGVSASAGSRPPAVITSAESHYSVTRAAAMIGLGADHVLKAGLDDRRRMDPAAVRRILDSTDHDVFCLVGSACATPVGAFDPLDELADLAAEYGLWLHVDGAHGASALFSRRHRRLLDGIQRADSITWDAHKMLFVPALATFLFYKDAAHSFQTFRQDAPVLFDPAAAELAEFDSSLRVAECTKRALGLGLWGLWSTYGPGLFEDLVDVTFELGRQFHELILETDDFRALHEPECNIVCFRHVPASMALAPPAVLGTFQQAVRRRIVESGEFYITATPLDGVTALRVTLINPMTERCHMEALLEAIRRHGRELMAAPP